MRALYINLDRSPERRQWMEQQAASLGLALERIAAVDGAALDGIPAKLSAGALACFHSHRMAWEIVANGDDRYVAIFEDDVHMSPDLPCFLGDPSWIPEDADIVHIGRSQERCIVINDRRKAMDRALYLTVTENSGGDGYIMSRQCARRLRGEFTDIDQEFDQVLFNQNAFALRIYKLVPSLCIQDRFLPVPKFGSQIDRKAKTKSGSRLWREVMRQVRKLRWGTVQALGLAAPIRIDIQFR
ncbi:glycosyltransferase family 25 protein [Mesorhizobium sp. VNQ89]|uniref:glycosyltransferase family 25 protein n=1 Tax=Mesorhizobium quangtriensis TaxID=3157709 RepID=UPI0032B704FF